MNESADWYVPLAGDGPARVIAFPHAGAGCAQLAGLARALAPDCGLWAANLPGRQARLDTEPISDLDAVVDVLAERMVPLADRPYALFGYCGGALLAFLVARLLRGSGTRPPAALVVASHEAPDIAERPRGVATLPSEQLWEALAAAGGVSADLAADERLRRVAEPAVRADFAALASYRHLPQPPLPFPVYVCFGEADAVPRGALLGWRRQSGHPPRMRPMPGGHWLLDGATTELAAVVREALTSGEPR